MSDDEYGDMGGDDFDGDDMDDDVEEPEMEDDENTKVDWNEVKKIFKSLDKDGDRCVDWEEFFVKLEIN